MEDQNKKKNEKFLQQEHNVLQNFLQQCRKEVWSIEGIY